MEPPRPENDASDFLFLVRVRDILGLALAIGYRSVAAWLGMTGPHRWEMMKI